MNTTFIPVTFHSYHHGSGNLTFNEMIISLLIISYMFYLITVIIDRAFENSTRKEFIKYLLIPFSMWIIGFIALFKKDE